MFIEQMPEWVRWLYPSIFWRGDKHSKVLYLTFDDGPIPENTPWLLDTLDEFGIKATFFCIGNNAEKHPELLEDIRKRGHQVGIHGYAHQRGLYKNQQAWLADIAHSEELIGSTLFRPPHGNITPWQAHLLSKRYKIVLWDVITRDYNRELGPEKIFQIATRYARNGSVIVFHDSLKAQENMRYAFPKAVRYWLEKGYTFRLIH